MTPRRVPPAPDSIAAIWPTLTASPSPEDVIETAIHRAEVGPRPGGFGMLIARQVADEIAYNERGNELLLIKHIAESSINRNQIRRLQCARSSPVCLC